MTAVIFFFFLESEMVHFIGSSSITLGVQVMGTCHAGGGVLRMHSHNGYHPAPLKITAMQCLLRMVPTNNPVSSLVQRTSGGGAAMEVYIRTDFLTSRHANQTRNEVKSDGITHAHLHN